MKHASLLGLAVMAALTGCGGGGSDGSGNSSPSTTISETEVVADLTASNISFLPANRPLGTWRWTGTPARRIPVYVTPPAAGSSTEQDYAAKTQTAITTLNTRLSGLLVLEAVTTPPGGSNYIHVSYGSSYVPPGSTDYASYCANVATAPGVGNMILPDGQNGIASSPVYVNLGNGHCDVT